METEKFIYGFGDAYGLDTATIKKYLIIKETAKTYTVTEVGGPAWRGVNLIKKSTMEAYSTQYALTYDEALERLKQTITAKIEANARQVVYLNSQSEKLAARLKELQAGGGNNDG